MNRSVPVAGAGAEIARAFDEPEAFIDVADSELDIGKEDIGIDIVRVEVDGALHGRNGLFELAPLALHAAVALLTKLFSLGRILLRR